MIYIMGGIYPKSVKANTSCLELDANMNLLEKDPMPRGARYNLALAVVIDKYIFAIGGMDYNH